MVLNTTEAVCRPRKEGILLLATLQVDSEDSMLNEISQTERQIPRGRVACGILKKKLTHKNRKMVTDGSVMNSAF